MGTLAQRRSLETRRMLLEAAARVFAEKGYSQATIDDVAAASGVSKGAVYHHFESKDELFRALLEDHGHELDAMAAVVGRARSFPELVRGVVAVWVDHYRSDALFAPLALESRAYAMREPRARAIVGEFYAQMRQLIAAMLRAGQDAGFVRRDLDVDAAASLLFGVLDGTCMQAAMDPERVPLAGLEDRIADLAERHVRSKGAGSLARLRASIAPLVEHSALRGDTVPGSSSRSTRRPR